MNEDMLKVILETKVFSIRNIELRNAVKKVLGNLPEAFWKRESSRMYHPSDERGLNGNLLHTLRVIKLVERIGETTSDYDEINRDILISCAILHDCLRHGPEGKMDVSSKYHPTLVRQLMNRLEIDKNWIELLCPIIEKHMGKFSQPSYPTNIPLSDTLHIADYIASQVDIRIDI